MSNMDFPNDGWSTQNHKPYNPDICQITVKEYFHISTSDGIPESGHNCQKGLRVKDLFLIEEIAQYD